MREIKHLSIHQWLRSAIPDSQQPTSPIGFLFLKLPPPPCAVLLVLLLLPLLLLLLFALFSEAIGVLTSSIGRVARLRLERACCCHCRVLQGAARCCLDASVRGACVLWSGHAGAAAGCRCRVPLQSTATGCCKVLLGCCCQSGVRALERACWSGAAAGCCLRVLLSEWRVRFGAPLQAGCCLRVCCCLRFGACLVPGAAARCCC